MLLISGYPTETLEDWEETKQWFISNAWYSPFIREIQIVKAAILPGTELERKKDTYGIVVTGPSFWANKSLNISTQQRMAYHSELVHLARSQGFTVIA